jgi:hypothetical protein
MATAADRLLALAGTTGTAGALLLLIGSGATAGAALVDYSGLASATAAAHLMADSAAPPAAIPQGGGWVDAPRRRKTENDEALLLLGLL